MEYTSLNEIPSVILKDFDSVNKNKIPIKLNDDNQQFVIFDFEKFDEKLLEKADYFIYMEKENIKDSNKQYQSGLNETILRDFKRENTGIAISFEKILESKDPKFLGRIIQNIKLAKKAKVKILFSNFSTKSENERLIPNLYFFARKLGLETNDLIPTKKQRKYSVK